MVDNTFLKHVVKRYRDRKYNIIADKIENHKLDEIDEKFNLSLGEFCVVGNVRKLIDYRNCDTCVLASYDMYRTQRSFIYDGEGNKTVLIQSIPTNEFLSYANGFMGHFEQEHLNNTSM